jgi:outer membrane lipoprotein-sorting protein
MPFRDRLPFFALIGWLALVTWPADAQSLAQVLARFRQVCDAQGHWQQSSSYVEVTEELWGTHRARATLFAKRPLTMKRVLVREGIEYVFCYDQNNNWKLDPTVSTQPVKMKKSEEKIGYRYFSSLDMLFNDSLMAQSELVGLVEFRGVKCYAIRTPEPDGGQVYSYLRAKNYQPFATQLVGRKNQGDLVKVYQSFQGFADGVVLPVVAEYWADGKFIGRTRTVDFRLNETLDPSVFVPRPPGPSQQN